MKNKLTIEKLLEKDWTNHIKRKIDVGNLLEDVGITDHEVKLIHAAPADDGNRVVVISETVFKEDDSYCNIVIDMKRGDPTWEQAMDAAFGIHRICDKRIILFDGHWFYMTGLGVHKNLVKGFVQILNSCGHETYLVKLKPRPKNINRLEYDIIEKPGDDMLTKFTELPSKDEFKKYEFWVGYVHTRLMQYRGGGELDPDSWSDYSPVRIVNDMKIWPEWDSHGLFIHVEPQSDSSQLDQLWKNYNSKILSRYPSCRVQHNEKSGSIEKLSVRLRSSPFQLIPLNTPSDIIHYADIVIYEQCLLEKLFEALCKDPAAVDIDKFYMSESGFFETFFK